LASPTRAPVSRIDVFPVRGAITPVIALYLGRSLDQAEKDGATAAVIALDTPGGLDSAMRDIIQHMQASRIPVIVYVSPAGGRAASAGAFITEAADVAAMAPNTAIGAASPVGSGGEDIQGTMKHKVTNDAAAYIRGLATSHHRNADWAERAVRKAVSLNSEEAVKQHVVDLTAPDLPTLLDRIDGRVVPVGGHPVTLHTRHAAVTTLPMTGLEEALQVLSNPSVALVLLNLGMLGLFFELSNPGLILPGIIGGLCLLLGLFSMGMLPVNVAGLALIGFAFLLFIAELFIPTYGGLAVGGIISLVLGALMLIAPGTPGFEVSRPLIATIAGTTGALVALMVTMAVRAQRRQVTTGSEGLVGAIAEARTPLDPEGQVFLKGERWRAVSLDGSVPVGGRVQVRRMDNLTLFVVAVAEQPLGGPT